MSDPLVCSASSRYLPAWGGILKRKDGSLSNRRLSTGRREKFRIFGKFGITLDIVDERRISSSPEDANTFCETSIVYTYLYLYYAPWWTSEEPERSFTLLLLWL
ncbi:hypothetical protein NQ318_004698 [Aromia moschata]|uniref:Uncharacterized protein n=1 Tax=Aromia moschata TaxID=1265417 RepID=A0AAV8XHQ6_9CUCU|nr:hypothetical protein NQ318_004698 [Aromia moschata]